MATLRDRIAGALGRRPAPAAARKAGPSAAARAFGAVPLEARSPRALRFADFVAGSPIVNTRSVLARHSVPRGDVYEVAVGQPFRAYISATRTLTNTPGAGVTTAALDLGALGLRMVRSTRAAAAVPFTTGHPDLIVYRYPTATPASIAVATVSAVDFDAGTLTVSGLTAETPYTFVVYYLPGDGELRIRASQPSGVDERTVELYNDTFAALHETDQADGRAAPRIVRPGLSALPLGPKWMLSLEVDSPHAFVWTAAARHQVSLPGNRVPVAAFDETQLNAVISGALLNG